MFARCNVKDNAPRVVLSKRMQKHLPEVCTGGAPTTSHFHLGLRACADLLQSPKPHVSPRNTRKYTKNRPKCQRRFPHNNNNDWWRPGLTAKPLGRQRPLHDGGTANVPAVIMEVAWAQHQHNEEKEYNMAHQMSSKVSAFNTKHPGWGPENPKKMTARGICYAN